ncbi:hypothetical protein TRFO_08761 [Tritrichomonas foetus]|uniref:Uncharacterized protein n=1 Tax=Tritrichomonas foetus TaxID=1144522 RepID=A0A1J4JMI4_9EUKA|nr:hypothetical protein TRFO_08761 [Tritrichomonas foetus]|eukprot:OHS98747.1 hypothetical protein TRFO_08761 [Tritrichomonas foetus]
MKSMKTDDSQNDQSNSFVQASSMSLNSSNIQKYGGIIEQNLYKKTVKQLTSLFDYVYSVSPSYKIVHYIITILRLLQFAGPSFCAAYEILWSNEDSAADTISILSIFFHLIPPAYRQAGRMIFIILYLVILSLIIVFLIVSAMYFHANADLPKIIPPFILFCNVWTYFSSNCI